MRCTCMTCDAGGRATDDTHDSTAPAVRLWPRLALLGVVLLVCVLGYRVLGDRTLLERALAAETALLAWRNEYPLGVFLAAVLLYVLVTGFSIPVATVLSLLLGKYLGFAQAVVVVSFGSTGGATVAMLVSRYLFRDLVEQKLARRWAPVRDALERDGPFYLFTLRMMPQIPFVVVNLLMGVSPIRWRTFWWVSQLGMLPATCLFAFTGSQLPDLKLVADGGVSSVLTWPLMVGFALLGCFPLVTRLVLRRRAGPRGQAVK